MAYKNTETGKVGTLFELLPNVSNPILLSETELEKLNIVKHTIVSSEPVLSLKELKAKKTKELMDEVHTYVTDKYPYYAQLSALNGTYDEATNLEITSWCDREVKRALAIKEHIAAATTKKEVNETFYRKVEINEETLEIISETFWGEDSPQ